MKPIIGIAANERTIVDSDSHWISYTPKNFVDGIKKAGGLALILPISSPDDAKDYVDRIDKLLLAGGQDICPEFYQQHPHQKLGATDRNRDVFELALIKEAQAQQKPIFGVCRGMQLLNVAFGGTLHQDLSLHPAETIKHVQVPTPFHMPTHDVAVAKDSLLTEIVGECYHVNSFHHQTIDRVADEFTVIATAPDGVIEGIHSKHQKIFGVQWHPELTHEVIESEQKIFDFFVNKF